MSSGLKEERKKQNKIARREERVKKLTGDSDFVWLMHDSEDTDNMTDQEILKEYKRYKKANPNGLNWEEL
jgi:hypothetical protein